MKLTKKFLIENNIRSVDDFFKFINRLSKKTTGKSWNELTAGIEDMKEDELKNYIFENIKKHKEKQKKKLKVIE